jgi:hypothetical protein
MKNKETLEEADEIITTTKFSWEQERSYSEEDMQEYAEFCIKCYQKELPCIIAKDWFKQFKKK